MLIIVSPTKSLDFETKSIIKDHTLPDFLDHSEQLIKGLKKLSHQDIADLMKISPKLCDLNHHRFQVWDKDFNIENAKHAILAFTGEVFNGLEPLSFSDEDFNYAQNHFRILSGLYGFLKPKDLIQAYRLEMGTKFGVNGKKNLYEFWDNTITNKLNEVLSDQGDDILVNLASNEYYKAVKPKQVKGKIITPIFKDLKNGQYKVVMTWAKKMRGMMSKYIIQNQINSLEGLKAFEDNGYSYNASMSTEEEFVFVR